jgi:DNA primase
MSAIDEIKQKIDITEVIGQYTALKKAGRNLTALCPFHSEKHPSFFVYPEQQSWHCFGACNTGGDVFAFVMKKEGVDFGEALRMLARRTGVVLPSREPSERQDAKEALYKANDAAALYFNNLLLNHPGAEKARDYVAGRGLNDRTVADFQLGFSLDAWEALKHYLSEKGYSESDALAAGLLVRSEDGRTHDRFRGKLMIPIRDIRGRVTGFGARVLDDSLPKYVNSPQTPLFDKSGTLYAIDRAAPEIRKRDAAIIMEGYMDVISAHQYGVTNAVACMGTAITETQVNALKKLSRNLLLSMDADAAGEEAMLRTVSYENILGAEMRVIVLPEGKDPDDVIREDVGAWQGLVEQAVPLVDFMFERTSAGFDLTTARDKSLAVDRLLPIVAEINNPVRQAHYLQKLASLVKVDLNTIKASLGRLRPRYDGGRLVRRTATMTPVRTTPPPASSQREEYLLALLLQNPDIDRAMVDLTEEHFESSENREIFNAWRAAGDVIAIRDRLDPAVREHFDALAGRKLPAADNIEKKCVNCALELRKKYLRSLAARRAAAGETGADTGRLEEDMEISSQLRELYTRSGWKNNSSASGRTRS